MADPHLYLCLFPESLVASMLEPEAFGEYMAVGTAARTRGQAMFFEIDPAFESAQFPFHLVKERCVAHPDGSPKRSLYLSVYRVLEHIPLSALGKLYLATDDGRVMGLDRGTYAPEPQRTLHLYQELCPADPCVASSLDPVEFCKAITAQDQPVHVPRIVFSELILRGLATDPAGGDTNDVPYGNIPHLRDCLGQLQERPGKKVKMVTRHLQQELLFRTIRNGFFVGDQRELLYYPMPSATELEDTYYEWWRSALTVHAL